MTEVVDSQLTVHAAVLSGTDVRVLASRLADAVTNLPVTAAAMVAPSEMPAFAIAEARKLGERQCLAEAAADFVMYVVRLWHQADEHLFPADRIKLAVRLRVHWEAHVCGIDSGLTSIAVFPVGLFHDGEGWLTLARRCEWAALTTGAPDGLIPAG